MKKILTAAAIALFMITSCSDEDSSSNNNNNSDPVLLKRMVETEEDGNTITHVYQYEANKLMSVTSDDSGSDNDYTVNYTYANGKLSKMEYKKGVQLIMKDEFSYNSQGKLGTLMSYKYFGGTPSVDRVEYTHNSNGTIATEWYTGDDTAQTDLLYETTFTFANGNILEEELFWSGSTISDAYTYDTKNSPMKNVFAADIMNLAVRSGGPNNILTYTVDGDEEYSVTYTYNNENYPLTSVKDNSGDITTIQYFYE